MLGYAYRKPTKKTVTAMFCRFKKQKKSTDNAEVVDSDEEKLVQLKSIQEKLEQRYRTNFNTHYFRVDLLKKKERRETTLAMRDSKAGDKVNALEHMRRKKCLEKEITKMETKILNIEYILVRPYSPEYHGHPVQHKTMLSGLEKTPDIDTLLKDTTVDKNDEDKADEVQESDEVLLEELTSLTLKENENKDEKGLNQKSLQEDLDELAALLIN